MRLQRVYDLADPRVAEYRNLRDADLRERGTFVAEGRLVVRALLTGSRFRARSVFVTEVALEALRDVLEPLDAEIPVYVATQDVMNAVAGFDIHRGCLASAERGEEGSPAEISARPGPVVLLEDLTNHDNVGAIFRNAAAFGAAGVLLTERCCDPLYRKAVRVSMGGALRVPFARVADAPGAIGALREAGFTTIALTPSAEATDIAEYRAPEEKRTALVLGTEGEGLSAAAMRACDARVRIAMAAGVDSLNVATAAAIALHRLGTR